MIPAMVEPKRAFVMVTQNDWQKLQVAGRDDEAFWSFTLQPLEDGQSRLIARVRGGTPPTLISRLVGSLFWEPAHFVRNRRCCCTVRDWAERGRKFHRRKV